MTEQEIFDKAVGGVLAQGRKSAESSDQCRYRMLASDGTMLKCAAGMLIPDNEYDDSIETIEAKSLWKPHRAHFFSEETIKLFKDHAELIQALQTVHDCYPVEEWKEQYKVVADKYQLEWHFK